MLITDTWVKLTSESGFGASLQKHGLYPVQISYAEVEPTTEDIFVLRDLLAKPFVDTQPKEFIWARALVRDTEVAVEETDLESGGVDKLRSFSFSLGEGQVILLPEDKYRTFFGITSLDDAKKVRIWVGEDPPLDTNKWLTLSIETLRFDSGVYGPIYIAEHDKNPAQLYAISSVDEAESVVDLGEVARYGALVTENGDNLVDELGNFLIGYY